MADSAIEPYTIHVSDEAIADLRARLAASRWPAEAPDTDWTRGIPGSYLRPLADYWQHGYDWRAYEQRLNALPQFTTTIDGATVHFIHARSPEPDATPLIITHGWPGSVVEFLDIIGPLTDPQAHGGAAGDAFHVVAPSIPGYAFSGPVTEPGWDTVRVAQAFAALMARLGYDRYAAQGGDWGSSISCEIGIADPDHVIGVHVNMLITPARGREPDNDDERERLAGRDHFVADGSGYNRIQSTRPQTLAYALTDSPLGQLAWIAEKFYEWTDNDGTPDSAVDRDLLLTNVSVYWFTGTAGSSAELYYESAHAGRGLRRSRVPTAVAVFPHDIARPVRRFAEDNDRIVRWTEFDRGGHFAAMEVPDLLVEDIRATFRDLT